MFFCIFSESKRDMIHFLCFSLESFSFPSKLEVFKGVDDESSNCHLTIRCKSVYHVGITGVQIVSESRNMEVYGQTEGYMHTIRGKSVPNSEDDTHYFISNLPTQEPTNCLTFKVNFKYFIIPFVKIAGLSESK